MKASNACNQLLTDYTHTHTHTHTRTHTHTQTNKKQTSRAMRRWIRAWAMRVIVEHPGTDARTMPSGPYTDSRTSGSRGSSAPRTGIPSRRPSVNSTRKLPAVVSTWNHVFSMCASTPSLSRPPTCIGVEGALHAGEHVAGQRCSRFAQMQCDSWPASRAVDGRSTVADPQPRRPRAGSSSQLTASVLCPHKDFQVCMNK